MICNTAVFYDVENLMGLFSYKSNQTIQLDEIHRRILDLEAVNSISIQRAYADWSHPNNRHLRSYILQLGIEAIQIFNTNQQDKVKNAADVSLILDAIELVAKNPEIENYVIASGDGIFAFLAKKLHAYGKRVIGCSFDSNTNINFQNACDVFIELKKEDKALVKGVGKVKSNTPVIHADISSPELKTNKPSSKKPSNVKETSNNLPKSKLTDVFMASDIPIWRNAKDLPGSLHTIKRLVNIVFSEEDDLEISLFKNYVDYYMPNFRIGTYGFGRFWEFMRFVLTRSKYCLTLSETTVVRIVLRDKVQEGHKVMDDIETLLFTLDDGTVVDSIFDINDGVNFRFDINGIKLEESKKEPAVAVDSARKWIKTTFEKLSAEDKLDSKELKKLTTASYCQKTFGVTVPVLKEIKTRANLREQRTENGRVKYWKDEFMFNGKSYFIFKEWTERAHLGKFELWIEGLKN